MTARFGRHSPEALAGLPAWERMRHTRWATKGAGTTAKVIGWQPTAIVGGLLALLNNGKGLQGAPDGLDVQPQGGRPAGRIIEYPILTRVVSGRKPAALRPVCNEGEPPQGGPWVCSWYGRWNGQPKWRVYVQNMGTPNDLALVGDRVMEGFPGEMTCEPVGWDYRRGWLSPDGWWEGPTPGP